MRDLGLAQAILYPLITMEFLIVFIMYTFFPSKVQHTHTLDAILGAFFLFNAISFFLYIFEVDQGLIEAAGFYIDIVAALVGAVYVMNIMRNAHFHKNPN